MFKAKKKKKNLLSLASTAKYRQVLIWNARSRRDSGAFNQLAAKISPPSLPPPPPQVQKFGRTEVGHTSGKVPREPKGRGDGH